MSKIIEKIKSLSPGQKRVLVPGLFIAGFIIIVLIGYGIDGGKKKQIIRREPVKKIQMDENLLEKSYSEGIRLDMKKKDEEIDALKKSVERLDDLVKETLQQKDSNSHETGTFQTKSQPKIDKSSMPLFPPPPPPNHPTPATNKAPPPPPPLNKLISDIKKESLPSQVGGIEIISVGTTKPKEQDTIKKRKVFLPPSFMDGITLNGFRAATMQGAKTYEKKILIRIKDAAFLPNDVKANLRGCFVLASAYGDLADERAHPRLTYLSCLNKKGESVIYAAISGFVIDSDGGLGLYGEVVTKQGALLGRSFLAGLFGGTGDYIKSANQTVSVSPLGSTQTVDPGKLSQAAIGGGLSTGFSELQRFYIEAARQTTAIIDVGNAKTITIVIDQGVELEIKDYCIGGIEECGQKEEDI